ncbi:MAG: hypothetical protein QOI66_905 [Myxococcales bacterium]|jgi:uncharacterized membrane protein YtjA (UPF0391 family)|nr:hypothetical protein [Myxococcales bacterium]
MLYWGLGFLVLAVTTLVLDSVGLLPGAGGFTNVSLIVALILLAAGALTLGHRHYHRRRKMRLHHAARL